MKNQDFVQYSNHSNIIQLQVLVVSKDKRYITEANKYITTIQDINQFVCDQLSLQPTAKITAVYQGIILSPEKNVAYYFNNNMDTDDPNDVIIIDIDNNEGIDDNFI